MSNGLKITFAVIGAIVLIGIIFVGWGISQYNKVVAMDEQVKAQWAQVENQDSREGTENRISVERKRYNEAVQALNTYRRTVFGRIFSAIAGVGEAAYYEVPATEKEAPKVRF